MNPYDEAYDDGFTPDGMSALNPDYEEWCQDMQEESAKQANIIEYVAIETKRFTDGHAHYGECAKVMVNGDWRFSTYIMQPYDTMLPVVMLTRIHEERWQAASFNLNTWSVDENITELAQLLPPF